MTALQEAIDDVSFQGGGVVELAAGTTFLDEPLVLQPNVWLRGHGPNTVLVASSGFPGAAIIDTGTNPAGVIRVSDLTIDGNKTHVDPGLGIGLWLQRVSVGSFVERVVFRNTMRSGVCVGSISGYSVGVSVRGNTFTGCGDVSSVSDLSSISFVNCIDGIISDNIIQDSALAIDLELHPGFDDRLIDILVSNNVIRTSLGAAAVWGIAVLGQPTRPIQKCAVVNNLLYSGGLPGAAILAENVSSCSIGPNCVL